MRAGGANLPEDTSDDLLAQGAGYYAESCAYCHGGPGQEPAEWSRGMRPEPPHLTEAATEWTDQEIHWIVSNGFKMTGMPAFSEHRSEEHTSELQSLMRISYAVFCLKKKKNTDNTQLTPNRQLRQTLIKPCLILYQIKN